VIGQIIYHASGRRLLRYQEEIEGFVVPERYVLHSEHDRSPMTPSSTITNTTAVEGDGEKGKEVVVDWYGDDDPENPQNWYVSISFHIKAVYPGSSIDVRRKRDTNNQVISQEIMARLVYHVNNNLCLYRFLNLLSSNTGRSRVFRSKRNSLSTRTIIIWYVNLPLQFLYK
jgi:hypothetical protein